ncbi:reverse transcriptase domain-containing protein [Tanacetum coccineum]
MALLVPLRVARKNRRRGTLNFRIDELHGCKIAFSVQRNNRKARCKENQSNPLHSPRNVEVPRPRTQQPVVDQVTEEKIQVAIHPEYPEQTKAIGSTLTKEGRKKLCGLLRQNLDIFAWKPTDMTGVPRHIAEHRWLSAIGNRLEGGIPLQISFQMLSGRIQGIPSNKNGKGRRGKDSVYHKPRNILLLENAGATYQRLVDKAFLKQIGRNLEAYVDDLVIKSCTEQEVIRDVEETFRTLKKINMKLNPKKYTFGMKEGVFLGYKVNSDGLMVCPDKVEAVLSLPSPKCLKDVQRLNRKLASLNSRNVLPANEKVDSRIAYDGRTIRERRINHLLGSSKRGHQCRPDDGEGREANTHLFRQPSTVRSANKADAIKLGGYGKTA